MINKKIAVFCFSLCILLNLTAEDFIHVIQKGETVYAISKKYNVPAAAILEKNNIADASKIKAGQKLIIPKNSKTAENKNSSKQSSHKIDSKSQKTETYIVQKGDSLFGLAKKLGIEFSELLQLNNLTSESLLKIGDKLKIPQSGTVDNSEEPQKTAVSKNSASKEKQVSSKQANAKLLWPVPAAKVSYLSGKVAGVTMDTVKGEAVKAVTSGKVVSTGPHRGFGQVVFIQSKTKHIYVYGGMEKISVKKGDTVKAGQKLGEAGTEIFTNKAKIYFMVYYKNKPIDPEKAPREM